MNIVEISVDSLESAMAAAHGGVQRIELCSGLREGGLTPSLGLIRAARTEIDIDLFVLIRPRSGDFLYSNEEFRIMQDDITIAAAAGAQGVVLGLLTVEGDVDVERTRMLVQTARPMQVTFHRAFDMVRDLYQALEEVIETGADRILTSGGAPSALLGRERLMELDRLASSRVKLLAGGGVRPVNVAELASATGITEFHSSMRSATESPMRFRNTQLNLGTEGTDEYSRTRVLLEEVKELVSAANKPRNAMTE